MESNENDALQRIADGLASERLTISRLDDGSGVVLDVQQEQLLSMNAAGLFIVQTIADGVTDEIGIAQLLVERFAVSAERARNDVQDFVQTLSTTL